MANLSSNLAEDQIEKTLADVAERCLAGWKNRPPECASCPAAEAAALSAAALVFYREQKKRTA